MNFDWITWSIWGVGLAILIIWIIKTFKEFRGIFLKQSKMTTNEEENG